MNIISIPKEYEVAEVLSCPVPYRGVSGHAHDGAHNDNNEKKGPKKGPNTLLLHYTIIAVHGT